MVGLSKPFDQSYAILFACDISPLGDLGQETIARCNAAAAFYKSCQEKAENVIFAVAAGHHPSEYQRNSFAQMMAEYLTKRGVPFSNIIIGELAWGTYDEEQSAFTAIFEHAETNNFRPKIWYITSWYHIPRVVLLRMWIRKSISFRAVPVKAGSWRMLVSEVLALGGVVTGLRLKRTWRHNPAQPTDLQQDRPHKSICE